MGRDKSLIQYHDRNQRHHTFNLLSKYCRKVFISCNNDQAKTIDLPHIEDNFDCHGPLSGIITALDRFKNKALLVIACDMPKVDDKVIQNLLEQRDHNRLATCFYHDYPEPLCTIWEPQVLAPLKEFIHSGNIRPTHFLISHKHNLSCIEPSEEIVFKLANINTPGQMPDND